MRCRLGFLFVLAAASLPGAVEPPEHAFTAHELAQGYRDHFLLARPWPAHRAGIAADEQRDGVRVRRVFSRLRDLRLIELDAGDTPAGALARLRATGRYEFVEPDYIRHVAIEPNDPAYANGSMWQLKNTGANNGIAGADIEAPAAWDIVHDAPNVVVAVVDTGINPNHQDLSPNLWLNPSPSATVNDIIGANFVGGNGTIVSGDPTDQNGHGTHVAGTIGAAGNNGVAIPGLAWQVRIMAVKVFGASGSGPVSEIAAGVDYAVSHGANIINASYGENGTQGYSNTELAAITAAHDAGVIFVAAAGNSAENLDAHHVYPASYPLDNVVTVGASTNRDELALFTNYGTPVDLFAPGQDIVSLNYATTTGTVSYSGTSMAAPHVTGTLALLKAHFPSDTYRQLINRLLRGVAPSANPTATFVGKCQTGGRLDVLRALTTTTNRPFNDDFAARPQLGGDEVSVRSNNAGATAESGEPAHAGFAAASSLWWEWTASSSGTVSIDTIGSDYDTVVAVYTGTSLATLQPVAANDNAQGFYSRVTFPAVAGTAYEIAVDGRSGASGLTLLNIGTTAVNDNFATPAVLGGTATDPTASVTASNAHCSRETGEPKILNFSGGTSVWYRWTAPVTGHFQVAVVTDEFDPLLAVYTGSSLGSLALVSAAAGSAQTGALCDIAATAGTTYAITVDAKTSATAGQFTLTLNDSHWQFMTGDNVTAAPAVAPNGTVYVGGTDGLLYALGPDGSKLWSYTTAGSIDTCSPAVAADGTVYVGSNDGTFTAVNPDGTVKWKRTLGAAAPVSNSPALAADGTIYAKAGNGYVYAFNPANGTTKWTHNVHGPLTYASPSVGPDGTIYQGVEGGVLYALNPADGSEKWTYTVAGQNDIYSVPAIDASGNLYFTVLTSGKLTSLTAAGSLRWTYSGASIGASSSPTLSADGSTVYYAGYDAKLHAVNSATGAVRWVYSLGGEVRASSPAIDASGVIYIGTYDYQLYAINPDGTLKRTWKTAGWIRSCPAIAGSTLYVGSNDHKVYALDLGVAGAGGAWPQYRQNARRTGRAPVAPVITAQPASQNAAAGGTVTLSAAVSGAGSPSYQWLFNGAALPGATASSLALSNLQPAAAGLYTVTVTGDTSVTSSPALVGVTTSAKVVGSGSEVGPNIVHPNGNTYDQVLLTGSSAAITADPGQVTRLSYIDLTDDIVQVEFAGHGTLALTLDNATGPAVPLNYNQPSVAYMKGHAHIVIAGADATTNVSVFTVGRATAFDPTGAYNFLLPIGPGNQPADNGSPLFDGQAGTHYDGIADLASIAISSTDGQFGGIRVADAHLWASQGLAGIYAPGVTVAGPVYLGNLEAFDAAAPVLLLGGAGDARVTGGDLFQANGAPVQVSGLTQLVFTAGTDSAGNPLPAQSNLGLLEDNGIDVTLQIVVNPPP